MEAIKRFLAIVLVLVVAYYIVFMSEVDIGNLASMGWIFVFLSFFLLLSIIMQWYRKKIVNRVEIAAELFFLFGAIGFLADIPLVFLLFKKYRVSLAIFSLAGVGLLTTFGTSAGFVGVTSSDKKAVLYASLKLLFLTLIFVLFSLYTWAFSIVALILIESYRECLRKQIAGEKVSDWSFKW